MRSEPLRGGPTARASALPPMPVIVGSPRSGTTLLRFMLDSHPQLSIPPETGFFWALPELTATGDRLREQFFRAIINYPSPAPGWPDFEIPADLFWQSLAAINPFQVAEGYRAFYRLYAARFNKSRWGEKTPLYALSLDPIRQVLPEARFIHIIRDGRDAALSLRKMWFSPGWRIETQASYWRDCVLAARRAGINHSDYLEVRYENLIRNTRETLKKICDFIQLDFDDAMLRYHLNTPARLKEHKGRYHADGTPLLTQEQRLNQQKRTMEPPNEACVFAWKSGMSQVEIGRFQAVAGDLLSELGYEV